MAKTKRAEGHPAYAKAIKSLPKARKPRDGGLCRVDAQPWDAAVAPEPSERGHVLDATQSRHAPPASTNGSAGHPIRDALDSLVCRSVPIIKAAHAKRRFAMKSQRMVNLRVLSYVRLVMGWYKPTQTKEDRDRIKADSQELIKAMKKGQPCPEGLESAYEAAGDIIMQAAQSRAIYDAIRRNAEKAMTAAVQSLPVWPWAEAIRGFGAVALGSLIGETGDLSAYANVAKVWKRLGLAPPECYAMVTKRGKKSRAIPRERRSVVYTVGDALIKGNRDGDVPLAYRKLYLDRKAAREAAGWGSFKIVDGKKVFSKMHRHRDAQRYMEKRLVADLWEAWAKHRLMPESDMPDASQ